MQLSEELLHRRHQEEEEAQHLESMVQSVEQNLCLMTVRSGTLADPSAGLLLLTACPPVPVCLPVSACPRLSVCPPEASGPSGEQRFQAEGGAAAAAGVCADVSSVQPWLHQREPSTLVVSGGGRLTALREQHAEDRRVAGCHDDETQR